MSDKPLGIFPHPDQRHPAFGIVRLSAAALSAHSERKSRPRNIAYMLDADIVIRLEIEDA